MLSLGFRRENPAIIHMLDSLHFSSLYDEKAYLLCLTTHIPLSPFRTTDPDKLFPHIVVWLFCEPVIGTWELGREETGLPAVSADRAASGFVDWCEGLCCDSS